MLGVYKEFCENVLAMPVLDGQKSASEKFAGASKTYSIEALMGDGRALQAGTSHDLGQNFAKAFEIQFQGRDKTLQHAWTTSWGVSTRLIGGVIMTHGDDSGLVLPPRIAPYQVVIVPIQRGNWQETVLPKALEVQATLVAAGVRVFLDKREEYTPGWKFAEWEMRGVPLRLEIGPKDIEKGPGRPGSARHAREAADADRRPGVDGHRTAGDDSAGALRQGAEVPRGAHVARRDVGRVRRDHGRASRLRRRPLVRRRRLRGADQDRDAGDDSQPAVRAGARRDVHPLRQAGDHGSPLREVVLAAFSVQSPAGSSPATRSRNRVPTRFMALLRRVIRSRATID